MTLEYKSQCIEKLCEDLESDCVNCPLFEVVRRSGKPCYGEGANIGRNYAILFGDVEDQNPYWERICKLSDKQRAKGMETYGQGLESNPAAMLKRIEHLQEELVDALMYCEWIKDKMTEL